MVKTREVRMERFKLSTFLDHLRAHVVSSPGLGLRLAFLASAGLRPLLAGGGEDLPWASRPTGVGERDWRTLSRSHSRTAGDRARGAGLSWSREGMRKDGGVIVIHETTFDAEDRMLKEFLYRTVRQKHHLSRNITCQHTKPQLIPLDSTISVDQK